MNKAAWTCKLCGWPNAQAAFTCASCDKGRPKAKSKRAVLPQLETPNPCVVLGLDVANKSGWAIGVNGKIVGSGEHQLLSFRGARETTHVVERALRASNAFLLPVVAIFERPWGGRMGLGATKAEGYWQHALLAALIPTRRMGNVYPSQWRAVELNGLSPRARREEIRPVEQARAREVVGREVGEDEAPAILITQWGMYSPIIGGLL